MVAGKRGPCKGTFPGVSPKMDLHSVPADSGYFGGLILLKVVKLSWGLFFGSEAHGLVTSNPAVTGGWQTPPYSPTLTSGSEGLPQSQPGKWHRPSASHPEETPG